MNEPITLDGRKFTGFLADSIAADQDAYLLAHLRRAVDAELRRGREGAKQTREQRAEEMLTQIYLSGRTHHILAGYLTEEGRAWNRKEADANAIRFGAITNIEEKAVMRSSIVSFVIGFCSDEASSEAPRN